MVAFLSGSMITGSCVSVSRTGFPSPLRSGPALISWPLFSSHSVTLTLAVVAAVGEYEDVIMTCHSTVDVVRFTIEMVLVWSLFAVHVSPVSLYPSFFHEV